MFYISDSPDNIVSVHSIQEAGIWDGVNRLSSFYMLIFNTGLSMYYMPKLASLKTDSEFKMELKSYFKNGFSNSSIKLPRLGLG